MNDHSKKLAGSSDQHDERVEAAKAAPHDHVPRLVTSHHGHEHVHGTGTVGRFNNRLAVLVTKSVGGNPCRSA